MTVIFTLGVSDLPDPKNKNAKYALLISDTVKIGLEGAAVLTEGCTKLKDVVMELEVSTSLTIL
jgi:nucleosome binding factor SPN SPT16 subunit